MIEIVYEKEKQKSEGNESFFRIPNNIRQIGEVGQGDGRDSSWTGQLEGWGFLPVY